MTAGLGGRTAGVHTAVPAPARPARPGARAEGRTAPSAHPDPRVVYTRTELGILALRSRSQQMSIPARRLLMVIDGERPLGHLPTVIRPADMPALLKELESLGMIALAGLWHEDLDANAVHPDLKLAEIKRSLAGAFEAELGPEASVLEARVQDCVNLVVLRNVLREVITLVAQRKDTAAADRVAAIVKEHGPF